MKSIADWKNRADRLLDMVIEEFDITRSRFLSKSRRADLIQAREVYCGVLYHCTSASLPDIAALVGRSHSTVRNWCIGFLDDGSEKRYQRDEWVEWWEALS